VSRTSFSHRRLALVLLLAGTLTASGCGGGEPERLSKGEYVGKANAICKDNNRRINQLDKPTSRAEIPDFVRQGERITDRLLPRLEALEPPEEDEADIDRFVARLRDGRALVKRLAAATESTNRAELQDIAVEAKSISADTRPFAKRYGLTACVGETPAPGG
jgi:hypothetical protein